MQNFDELAEGYISAVEKQKESEGKAVDSFTRGDMETCFVAGAQSMETLKEGCEGAFGQAIGSLKRGFKVRRNGWNGKGMWLWLKQETMVKSEWCHDMALKAIADQNGGKIHALGTICMKTADNKVLTGWLASQTDMLSEDWVLVNPNE
jgi:hypothetical protein